MRGPTDTRRNEIIQATTQRTGRRRTGHFGEGIEPLPETCALGRFSRGTEHAR
jgi:hypothetical protein